MVYGVSLMVKSLGFPMKSFKKGCPKSCNVFFPDILLQISIRSKDSAHINCTKDVLSTCELVGSYLPLMLRTLTIPCMCNVLTLDSGQVHVHTN